jgi:hypothetical protein
MRHQAGFLKEIEAYSAVADVSIAQGQWYYDSIKQTHAIASHVEFSVLFLVQIKNMHSNRLRSPNQTATKQDTLDQKNTL